MLEPGDIVMSYGDHVTFQVFFEDEDRWSSCFLERDSVWLVLETKFSSSKIMAHLLLLTELDSGPYWIEGGIHEWSCLDKFN
jgi:hypothetical protein